MGASNDVFNAIWTALKSDPDMSARMAKGTMYPFTGEGVLKQMEVTPAICPVFALAPAPGGHHWPPAKRKRGPGLVRVTTFTIEMATAGEDSRDIVDLAEAFEDFMARQFAADGFGLGATFAEAEYSNQSYKPVLALTKHIELWQFTMTMTCRFRIS
jgi:hypothetical protein